MYVCMYVCMVHTLVHSGIQGTARLKEHGEVLEFVSHHQSHQVSCAP